MQVLTNLLFLSPACGYWPTYKGEIDQGSNAQQGGPGSLEKAFSVSISSSQPALEGVAPFVGADGTVYVLSADSLTSFQGTTLERIASVPLGSTQRSVCPTSNFCLFLQQSGNLWVNGLGLLQGGTLQPLPSALNLQALIVSESDNILLSWESPGFALRGLDGSFSPTCPDVTPVGYTEVLETFRADNNKAFFVMTNDGSSTALVSLTLEGGCPVNESPLGCGGGERRGLAFFFSNRLASICHIGTDVRIDIFSTADLSLVKSIGGISSETFPAYAGVFINGKNQLIIASGLLPDSPLSLSAYDPSTDSIAPVWTAKPSNDQIAPYTGLAVDKDGRIFASCAARTSNYYGGFNVFDGSGSSPVLQSKCCASPTDCPNCGVYSPPAIGLDGTLYSFVSTAGQWEGLITLQAPPPPSLTSSEKSSLLLALGIAGGVVGAALLFYLILSARRSCQCCKAAGAREGDEESTAPFLEQSSPRFFSPAQGGSRGLSSRGAAPPPQQHWQQQRREDPEWGERRQPHPQAQQSSQLSVKELRAKLTALGVSHAHCVERAELVALLEASASTPRSFATSSAVGPKPRFMTNFAK